MPVAQQPERSPPGDRSAVRDRPGTRAGTYVHGTSPSQSSRWNGTGAWANPARAVTPARASAAEAPRAAGETRTRPPRRPGLSASRDGRPASACYRHERQRWPTRQGVRHGRNHHAAGVRPHPGGRGQGRAAGQGHDRGRGRRQRHDRGRAGRRRAAARGRPGRVPVRRPHRRLRQGLGQAPLRHRPPAQSPGSGRPEAGAAGARPGRGRERASQEAGQGERPPPAEAGHREDGRAGPGRAHPAASRRVHAPGRRRRELDREGSRAGVRGCRRPGRPRRCGACSADRPAARRTTC